MGSNKCKQWLSSQGYESGAVKNALVQYCASDERIKNDPICRRWLAHPSGWGMHDNAVAGNVSLGLVGYCEKPENKDDPICSCVNSPLGGLAACWDENCIGTDSIGYQTGGMTGLANCGSYCNQEVTVSGTWNADDVTFYGCPQNQQPPILDARGNVISVGDGTSTSGGSTSGTSGTSGTGTDDGDDGFSNNQMMLMFFIFIIGIAFIALMFTGDDTQQPRPYPRPYSQQYSQPRQYTQQYPQSY